MTNVYCYFKQINLFLIFLTLIVFIDLRCISLYASSPSSVDKPSVTQENQASKCYGCPPKDREILPEKTLDELINMLRTTRGSFREPNFDSFQPDGRLFNAISEYGHAAVERLVDRLDSTEPTSVIWHGKKVWLGVLCWLALRYVASYEPQVEESWEGVLVEMPQTQAELQKVKQAWQKIVRKRLYVLQ